MDMSDVGLRCANPTYPSCLRLLWHSLLTIMLFMASKITRPYQDEVTRIAQRLGERIRAARVFRRWRQEDLAERTGLSRSSIQSIERGDETVAICSVLQVLWVLGLANEVELIADPGLDRDGLSLALDAAKKRVHVQRKVDDDF